MQLIRGTHPGTLLALGILAFAAACSGRDNLIQPPVLSPLAGLNESTARDSAGTTPPPPVGTTTPGDVTGTVLGPSEPGAGNDSLATAPRVAGAEITVYPVIDSNLPVYPPQVGPPIATTITGADGKFSLPGLPGGPVAVTVEPPSGSPYAGMWISTVIHSGSGEYPWWVVLPRK